MSTIYHHIKEKTYFVLVFTFVFFHDSSPVKAISLQDFRKQIYRPNNLPSSDTVNASAETKILDILQFLIDLVLFASGSVAVLILVYAGIRLITSAGNTDQRDQALKILKWAVAGLAIVILAFAVVSNVIDLIYQATT